VFLTVFANVAHRIRPTTLCMFTSCLHEYELTAYASILKKPGKSPARLVKILFSELSKIKRFIINEEAYYETDNAQ
jgi:hypothetical protein